MRVVDTNMLVYLLVECDKTPAARALFTKDGDWRSEYFMVVELTNVLATYVNAKRLPLSSAEKVLSEAISIMGSGLQLVLPEIALKTAEAFHISAYDARFVELARVWGTKLITEDAKLRRAAPEFTMSLAEATA